MVVKKYSISYSYFEFDNLKEMRIKLEVYFVIIGKYFRESLY